MSESSSKNTHNISDYGALQKTKRHSTRVQGLRRLLPIMSILLILAVILWVNLDSFFEEKIEGIPKAVNKLSLLNKVENPRFHMADKDGNPIRIQAESGTQKSDTEANLISPSAEFVGPGGEQVALSADKAFVDQKTKNFIYEGNVHLKSDQGTSLGKDRTFDLHTDKVVANLKDRDVSTDTPVVVKTFMGNLEAPQGFAFKGDKKVLTFIGTTRLVLQQKGNAETEVIAPRGIVCDFETRICKATGNIVTTRKSADGTSKMTSDSLSASFDQESEEPSLKVLLAEGNVKITHGKLDFKASAHSARYDLADGKLFLEGRPIMHQGANTLYVGRNLIIDEFALTARAMGRSTLKVTDKLLQADHMTFSFKKNLEGRLQIDRLNVHRNVKLSTAKEFITANKGVYHAGIKVTELFGDVQIKRDIGVVRGKYMKFDMVTGRSQLRSSQLEDPKLNSSKGAGAKATVGNRVHLVLEPLQPKSKIEK